MKLKEKQEDRTEKKRRQIKNKFSLLNEKKITAGKGRRKMRKSLNEIKGKGETTPKPGIQKKQIKCHNDRYI